MKRLLDIFIALTLLLLVSPLMLLIAVMIWLKLGKGVVFIQVRPGYQAVPFKLVKFRTMNKSQYPGDIELGDAFRMTPLGAFLRRTSLDELPELYNVIKGDMSMVGPRPLLVEYLGRYTSEQARRHSVKPGITGWAQINGRNEITWEDKFKLDVWYVDNWSLTLDLKILAKTIKMVLKRDGISAPGEATMPMFMGKPAMIPPGCIDEEER